MALVELAAEVPNTGGLVACITGDNSLADFGKELKSFGPNLSKYSESVSSVNTKQVANSAKAAMELVKMAGEVPNTGGLVAAITGDNSLGDFGAELNKFGPKLKKYSESIIGVDTTSITNSAKAAKELAKMADSLRDYDYDDLDDFPDNLPSFGSSIKKYSDNVTGVSTSEVKKGSSAAKTIASMLKDLSGKDYLQGVNTARIKSASSAVKSIASMMKMTKGINVSSVVSFRKALDQLSKTDLNAFVSSFSSAAPKAANSVRNLLKVLNTSLKSGTSMLRLTMAKIVTDMLESVDKARPLFDKAGRSIGEHLVKGLNANKKRIASAFTAGLNTAISSITRQRARFYNAGSY